MFKSSKKVLLSGLVLFGASSQVFGVYVSRPATAEEVAAAEQRSLVFDANGQIVAGRCRPRDGADMLVLATGMVSKEVQTEAELGELQDRCRESLETEEALARQIISNDRDSV